MILFLQPFICALNSSSASLEPATQPEDEELPCAAPPSSEPSPRPPIPVDQESCNWNASRKGLNVRQFLDQEMVVCEHWRIPAEEESQIQRRCLRGNCAVSLYRTWSQRPTTGRRNRGQARHAAGFKVLSAYSVGINMFASCVHTRTATALRHAKKYKHLGIPQDSTPSRSVSCQHVDVPTSVTGFSWHFRPPWPTGSVLCLLLFICGYSSCPRVEGLKNHNASICSNGREGPMA